MLTRIGSTYLMKSLLNSAEQYIRGVKGFREVFDSLQKQYAISDFRAKCHLFNK